MISQKNKWTLEKCKSSLHKWWYFTDDEIVETIFAGLIAEHVPGDPLWLFLIAPPGSLKTEFLRSITTTEKFYHLSDLTSKTFVSGLMLGQGEKRRKIEDLLPQLNRKILLFKDFTTVLEKSSDERQQIFAQLREIYDGSFSKKFGTIDETVRYDSRFGIIAGVTPVIDKHWKLMQQLGERFLKIRWDEDMDMTTKKSRENEGKEDAMRKQTMQSIMGFLENIDYYLVPKFDDTKFGDELSQIAKFVAYARTPVAIQDQRNTFYHDYIATPERPTRLVKQFKKFCRCLAMVRSHKEVTQEEINTARRIARDTVPQERLAIIEMITNTQGNLNGCPLPTIVDGVRMPRESTKRVLEQLKLIGLVKEIRVSDGYQHNVFYQLPSWVRGALYPLTLPVSNSLSQGVSNKDFSEVLNES